MVESSKKTNDEWGIDGLEHPKKHYYNQKLVKSIKMI